MKKLIKKMLHRTGYTVTAAPSLGDFLKSRSVTLVLDVGANKGQFARHLRSDGYAGEIISFEPIKSVYAQLSTSMQKDKRWVGKNIGLGDQSGKATINVSEDTVFSSIMPQRRYATEFDEAAHTVRFEEIEIDILDNVMSTIHNHSAIFCKIDTQGFEQAVLRGAENSLDRLCGLQLELPIEHLYEGTWTLSEAIAELDHLGFVPAQIRPTSFIKGDRASWTEIDCTFRRKSAIVS